MYGERLTEWERTEVRKYPEVWFLGLEANKVQARSNLPNNCGFDDENGSYNKVRWFFNKLVKEPYFQIEQLNEGPSHRRSNL